MPNLVIAAILLPFMLAGGDGSNDKKVVSGDNKDVIVKRSVDAGSSTDLCEVPPSLHYHCDCKVGEMIILNTKLLFNNSSWLVRPFMSKQTELSFGHKRLKKSYFYQFNLNL